MGALLTEKSCLECHEANGYKEGDIRGGLSVEIPFEKYYELVSEQRSHNLIFTLIITFLGLFGFVVFVKVNQRIKKELETEKNRVSESEEFYRGIFQQHSAVQMMIDPSTGQILDANHAAEKFYGYSREELRSMKIMQINILTPEEIKQAMARAVKFEQNYFEFRHRLKDGTIKPVEVFSGKIVYKDRIFLHSVIYDATLKKLAEKNLRESEERHRLIFENSPLGIFYFNTEGQVILANTELQKILGVPKEKLNGLNLFALPDKRVGEGVNKVLAGQKISGVGEYTSALSGKTIQTKIFFAPIYSENNQLLGGVGIIEDITEQHQLQKKIDEYINLLDELLNSKRIIEESLQEKTNLVEELIKTKTELEKLNQEKDKFFSIIAHDLRSPFQSFIGFLDLLDKNLYKFSIKELSTRINQLSNKAESLFQLLKNLLEWARIQRGVYPFFPDRLNLLALMDHYLKSIETIINNKEIKVSLDVSKNIYVFADENMLGSVILNLVTNAIKFSDVGGNVKISAKILDDNVQVSVSDEGIGMSQEILESLFRIDKKVGRRGTMGEESSGLGLLLCKEFIEKNNGKIWVESVENQGSTFYFTLPLYKEKK